MSYTLREKKTAETASEIILQQEQFSPVSVIIPGANFPLNVLFIDAHY